MTSVCNPNCTIMHSPNVSCEVAEQQGRAVPGRYAHLLDSSRYVGNYRHYNIWLNDSGKTFYVAGKCASVKRWFKSQKAAKEYIDFVIKFIVPTETA